MNDFPIPEDPPVMTTAEKSLRLVSGEGISIRTLNFRCRELSRERFVQPKSKVQI
jgi:hypothetical protein